MANGVNAPIGLKPSRFLSGATWNDQHNQYILDTAAGLSIFTNDPVVATANGGITAAAYQDPAVPVTAGTLLIGSFQGCEYVAPDGTLVPSPAWITGTVIKAGTTVKAFVTDDPNIIYDIQCSSSGAGIIAANVQLGLALQDIFQNAGFAAAGTFTTNPPTSNPAIPGGVGYNGGQSVIYLALNTKGATSTLPLKIIGLTPQIQNVFYPNGTNGIAVGNFNNASVLINTHNYKSVGTTGV